MLWHKTERDGLLSKAFVLESCLLANIENPRGRVRTSHGMDEHKLGTHFMPEYFMNTIDVIHFNSSIRFGLV